MGYTIKTPMGGTTLSTTTTTTKTTTATTTNFSLHQTNNHSISLTRKSSHITAASGKFNSRTSKFDSKNRRGGGSSTTTKEEIKENRVEKMKFEEGNLGILEETFVDDGFVVPELPGDKPDFWEGSQMDAVGFFFQYMWAFGVVFALVACGIAVATYNEGATDFKQTPAYKESVQSQNLLEEPEASDSDVFESNPTEEAPALK